jgi:hypothetical protein
MVHHLARAVVTGRVIWRSPQARTVWVGARDVGKNHIFHSFLKP